MILAAAIIGLLTLRRISPAVAIAALVLAPECVGVGVLLFPSTPTISVTGVDRHVGLALLLSTEHLQSSQKAIPAIASYEILALFVVMTGARPLCQTRKSAELT